MGPRICREPPTPTCTKCTTPNLIILRLCGVASGTITVALRMHWCATTRDLIARECHPRTDKQDVVAVSQVHHGNIAVKA